MSLKTIDISAALTRLAERRIEEAMKEGKFDRLRGMGQPIELEPMPADENTRMTWWMLRILRHNDIIPEEVRWRKALDAIEVALEGATSAAGVRVLVMQHNALVKRINTLGTNALRSPVAVRDEAYELARRRCG